MIRRYIITAALATLASGSAIAQAASAPAPTVLCGRTVTPSTKLLILADAKAGDAPACTPSQLGGKGTAATIKVNDAGATVWWYCSRTATPESTVVTGWSMQFLANTWARILTSRFDIEGSVRDYQAVWCPHWDAMLAGVPAVAAPLPAMATASTTAFRLARGALAGTAGTVARGTACECDRARLQVGTLTYCAFAGGAADAVAQCRATAK